jgi:hypothetical protein
VQVITADDGGDPARAVTLLQPYLHGPGKATLVNAGSTSDEASAMTPAAQAAGILSYSEATATSLNNPKKYLLHFGITPQDADELVAVGAWARKLGGVKKVAVVYPAAADGVSQLAIAQRELPTDGFSVVGVSYNPTSLDDTATWQKAMSDGVQAVYAITTQSVVPLLKGRLTAGATKIPVALSAAFGSYPLTTLVPAAALREARGHRQRHPLPGERPLGLRDRCHHQRRRRHTRRRGMVPQRGRKLRQYPRERRASVTSGGVSGTGATGLNQSYGAEGSLSPEDDVQRLPLPHHRLGISGILGGRRSLIQTNVRQPVHHCPNRLLTLGSGEKLSDTRSRPIVKRQMGPQFGSIEFHVERGWELAGIPIRGAIDHHTDVTLPDLGAGHLHLLSRSAHGHHSGTLQTDRLLDEGR